MRLIFVLSLIILFAAFASAQFNFFGPQNGNRRRSTTTRRPRRRSTTTRTTTTTTKSPFWGWGNRWSDDSYTNDEFDEKSPNGPWYQRQVYEDSYQPEPRRIESDNRYPDNQPGSYSDLESYIPGSYPPSKSGNSNRYGSNDPYYNSGFRSNSNDFDSQNEVNSNYRYPSNDVYQNRQKLPQDEYSAYNPSVWGSSSSSVQTNPRRDSNMFNKPLKYVSKPLKSSIPLSLFYQDSGSYGPYENENDNFDVPAQAPVELNSFSNQYPSSLRSSYPLPYQSSYQTPSSYNLIPEYNNPYSSPSSASGYSSQLPYSALDSSLQTDNLDSSSYPSAGYNQNRKGNGNRKGGKNWALHRNENVNGGLNGGLNGGRMGGRNGNGGLNGGRAGGRNGNRGLNGGRIGGRNGNGNGNMNNVQGTGKSTRTRNHQQSFNSGFF